MPYILAVVKGQEPGSPVTEVAAALGRLIGSDVRRLEVPADVLVVLAADADEHAACWQVMARAGKPAVLVPPGADPPAAIDRVLLPLDGTSESSAAVARAVDLLAGAGVDLVVLHVFDAATVPRFWDQPAHAAPAFAAEFLARHVAAPGARLELRAGSPAEHVVDVAVAERADLITLGWSQHLGAGRARTVRRCVQDSTVPVMLIPLIDR